MNEKSKPAPSDQKKPAATSAKTATQAELCSLAEIAALLRMTPLQVRKMAQTSQIPAVKVEGEWRFNKDLVVQAIKRRSRGM